MGIKTNQVNSFLKETKYKCSCGLEYTTLNELVTHQIETEHRGYWQWMNWSSK